jgi:hypothetical protein
MVHLGVSSSFLPRIGYKVIPNKDTKENEVRSNLVSVDLNEIRQSRSRLHRLFDRKM